MFVTSNQIFYFIESAFVGVLLGVFYEFFYFLKRFFKGEIIRQIIDFCFLPTVVVFYFKASEIFAFPNFRTYLFIGVLLGFSFYLASFHKSLAKVFGLVYNKTISFIRRKSRDRKQKAKTRSSRDRNGGSRVLFSNNNFGLSVRKHRRKNQGEKRPHSRKRQAYSRD